MADIPTQMEAEDLLAKTFDASDAEQVNDARKKEGRQKKKERETLQALMEYPNGRELMWNSVRCVLDGNPVVAGCIQSTYYNLGQEHRARELFKEIVRLCPKEFVLMIEEYGNS